MTFQILSLSGGGFLGLYTAAVLAKIEEHSERPIAEQFDLISGTSIGGIIGLGIAAGIPATKIQESIEALGPKIFSNKPRPKSEFLATLQLRKNMLGAKYSAAALKDEIDELFGKEAKIGDLKHRIIIPSINLTKGRPQVFKTAHHPTFVRDFKLNISDVALATAAAPTYFPLHKIGGELFADGGLYANAPDQLAIHEAIHFLGQDISEIRLLSIGTTTSKFSFSNSINFNMGWMSWLRQERLPSVMIAAQQMSSDDMLRHRMGENYLRIDQEQSREQEDSLGLDIATEGAIEDLKGLAEGSIREHLGRAMLPEFLKHTAPSPTFYHEGKA